MSDKSRRWLGSETGLYFVDMNADPKVTHEARCITARQGFEQFGETHFRAANGTVASGAVDAFCPDGSFAGGALTHMSAVHRKSVGRQIGALSHSSGAEPGRG